MLSLTTIMGHRVHNGIYSTNLEIQCFVFWMATDIYMTPLIITRHEKLKDELNFNQLAHCHWFVTRRLIRTREFFFESLSIIAPIMGDEGWWSGAHRCWSRKGILQLLLLIKICKQELPKCRNPQMQGARKIYIPECLHILCMKEIKQQPASQPSIPPLVAKLGDDINVYRRE